MCASTSAAPTNGNIGARGDDRSSAEAAAFAPPRGANAPKWKAFSASRDDRPDDRVRRSSTASPARRDDSPARKKPLVFGTAALRASIAHDSARCLDEHAKGRAAPVSTAPLRLGASGSEGRRREVRGERAACSSRRVHASRSDVVSA
ncbi:hypothetical protein [Lysobacter sp. Hz 25]|uniref:hypothetical protein n=1 Tax=Lysobacter sp. Hz 25 TaxID=3383698 RepID=UPI0038D38C7A